MNNFEKEILQQQQARIIREERKRHERNLELARKQPNIKFPESELLERIKEINEKKWPLCSECYGKSNNKGVLDRMLEYQNKLLERELEVINLKVETFKPKWIMNSFDSYLFNYVDEQKEKKLVCVKVRDKILAKRLIKLAKELNGEWNYGFKIEYKGGSEYVYVNRNLDKQKLFDLLRAYIFFGNTQRELKSNNKVALIIKSIVIISILTGLLIFGVNFL